MGGHSIPEETSRRRFERGRTNLFDMYMPITNAWRVFNAAAATPLEIARYTERYTDDDGEIVFDSILWAQIEN